jgi:hypothetical protein
MHDVFALVINFLRVDLVAKTCYTWSFWSYRYFWEDFGQNLIKLLKKYNLRKKIIAYVKDERSNLSTMTFALKIVVNCDILGLEESY